LDISNTHLDIVNRILADQDLKEFMENNNSGECVIDLYTWLEYIPIGHTKNSEREGNKANFD